MKKKTKKKKRTKKRSGGIYSPFQRREGGDGREAGEEALELELDVGKLSGESVDSF